MNQKLSPEVTGKNQAGGGDRLKFINLLNLRENTYYLPSRKLSGPFFNGILKGAPPGMEQIRSARPGTKINFKNRRI
jgi:hypothetical protein